MRRSSATMLIVMVLFLLFTVAPVPAVAPNQTLLSLVPPSAQVVAGMNAPVSGSQRGPFC